MNFAQHVKYDNQEWIVVDGFMSGNGTFDTFFVGLKNINTEEVVTVPEHEVEYISPF